MIKFKTETIKKRKTKIIVKTKVNFSIPRRVW